MLRVDGFYLYQVGWQIHPLANFGPQTTYAEARFPLYFAESALEPFLSRSVFRLRTSLQSGQTLLGSIRALKTTIEAEMDQTKTLDWMDAYSITSNLTPFEAVLGAELSLVPMYVVTPKAVYDVPVLIDDGSLCFPSELSSKVPEAVTDIRQATRCIAFELFTGAGFHLHRANESVLRRYWDAVTKGAKRPTTRNMGEYLNELNKLGAGDPKVRAALKDLKDLHRNPLLHPEDSIDNIDEAVALMNGVHTVVVHMLRAIPVIAPAPAVGALGTTP